MPASMMSAETGGSTKVAGSSIAMVAIGPMPGSTPISVPSRHPIRQYIRLLSVRATPKPSARLLSSSIDSPSGPADFERLQRLDVGAERDRELQADHEHQRGKGHQEKREDDRGLQSELMAAEARADDQDDSREQHADDLEEKPEGDDRGEHRHKRLPVPLLQLPCLAALGANAPDRDPHAEQEKKRAQPERKERRPHAGGRSHRVAGQERKPRDAARDDQEQQPDGGEAHAAPEILRMADLHGGSRFRQIKFPGRWRLCQ